MTFSQSLYHSHPLRRQTPYIVELASHWSVRLVNLLFPTLAMSTPTISATSLSSDQDEVSSTSDQGESFPVPDPDASSSVPIPMSPLSGPARFFPDPE